MKKVSVLGIDLAKQVFQVHGVDERGHRSVSKRLRRASLPGFIAQLPPCLIGMEACGSAHYWARKRLPEILEDADNSLNPSVRVLFARLYEQVQALDAQIADRRPGDQAGGSQR